MQLRSQTSTVTSTQASPGYGKAELTTPQITSSVSLQGGRVAKKNKQPTPHPLHKGKSKPFPYPEGPFFLYHPCSSLQFSSKPKQGCIIAELHANVWKQAIPCTVFTGEDITEIHFSSEGGESFSVNSYTENPWLEEKSFANHLPFTSASQAHFQTRTQTLLSLWIGMACPGLIAKFTPTPFPIPSFTGIYKALWLLHGKKWYWVQSEACHAELWALYSNQQ